jgi:hypothetical protein
MLLAVVQIHNNLTVINATICLKPQLLTESQFISRIVGGKHSFTSGNRTHNGASGIPRVSIMYHQNTKRIDAAEHEILLLLSVVPVSYFPPPRLKTIKKLARKGLIDQFETAWYPTSHGLIQIGQTVH